MGQSLIKDITDNAWTPENPYESIYPVLRNNANGKNNIASDAFVPILYGLGEDMNLTDLNDTGVTFTRCLFKSAGSDDDNFLRCLWDSDPLYMVDRMKYIFDYHLREGSPAIGAAEPSEFSPVLAPDGAPVDAVIGAYGPASAP